MKNENTRYRWGCRDGGTPVGDGWECDWNKHFQKGSTHDVKSLKDIQNPWPSEPSLGQSSLENNPKFHA